MYAIVDIAGQQFKVKKNQKMYVNRLKDAAGSQVEFDKVLLVDNEGKVTIGKPTLDGVRVAAKVLSHVKDDKVIVFKKKRRKGYKKMIGHRQFLSEILIQGILEKGEVLKYEEPVRRVKPKLETEEATPKEVKATKAKKTVTKKEVEPKETKTPKAAAKKTAKKKED